jgi:hypothetical protein
MKKSFAGIIMFIFGVALSLDGRAASGFSNFGFVEGRLELTWESSEGFLVLEKTLSLTELDWVRVPLESGASAVALPLETDVGFYRLRNVGVTPDGPPFGCDLDDPDCAGPSLPPWCFGVPDISEWEDNSEAAEAPPLKFDFWTGPYQNKAGFDAVARINQWYESDQAAGLAQDAFRSFDEGHSALRDFYPQLRFLDAVASYESECRDVFGPRVTFGVQSLAVTADGLGSGLSVVDYRAITEILNHYNPSAYRQLTGESKPIFTREFYRLFYETNMLLVSPAVNSFKEGEGAVDSIQFLSPYYLLSVGKSGSDRELLRPLVFAAASLPRDLKTRVMREGLQVPLLLNLFRQARFENVRSPEAHVPAYSLPEEAWREPPTPAVKEDGSLENNTEAYNRVDPQPAPFLDRLLRLAHELEHLPPVARLHFQSAPEISGRDDSAEGFLHADPYAVQAVLRPGETLTLELGLSKSWSDGRPLSDQSIVLLRDPEGLAEVEEISGVERGFRIKIPYQTVAAGQPRRTDLAAFVNDGTYDSAPAYISVRHLQEDERERFQF